MKSNTFCSSGLVFFVLLFCNINRGDCTVKTAILSGNWEAASTWSSNSIPGCGDTLIIPSSDSVTVTQQNNYTGCGSPMSVIVSGILAFQTGNKLQFPCGSYVAIKTGGKLEPGTGGGNSNLIDICGVTDWHAADGTISGPSCLPAGNPNCSAVLPITLVSFTAKWEQSSARLQWVTATEINNDHFEISRSFNGYDYETISTVRGQGNSTSIINYSYFDESVASIAGSNEIYYRLKQVDFDGRYAFYGPVVLNPPALKNKFIVFPNPLPKSSNLHLLISGKMNGKIILIDVYGRPLFSESFSSTELAPNLSLKLPDLATGLYTVICQSDGLSEEQKLIVVDN